MPNRGQPFNIPCLLFAFFISIAKRLDFFTSYIDAFIILSQPKIILTFIDNDPNFYKIKTRWNNVTTAFVQNGFRGYYADIFSSPIQKKDNIVDYMFVFGQGIARKYKTIIHGRTIAIGSFKSNIVPINKTKNKKKILFISQWTKFQYSDKIIVAKKEIDKNEFNKGKLNICKTTAEWALKNGYRFEVCGRTESRDEIKFYEAGMPDIKFNFSQKKTDYLSYSLIDTAEIVVYCDSTLGLEALGRGKKVAAFNFQYKKWGCCAAFGWESELPLKGLFWTDDDKPEEVDRILNYLNRVSTAQWEAELKKFQPLLMTYDYQNTIFNETINSIFCEKNKK